MEALLDDSLHSSLHDAPSEKLPEVMESSETSMSHFRWHDRELVQLHRPSPDIDPKKNPTLQLIIVDQKSPKYPFHWWEELEAYLRTSSPKTTYLMYHNGETVITQKVTHPDELAQVVVSIPTGKAGPWLGHSPFQKEFHRLVPEMDRLLAIDGYPPMEVWVIARGPNYVCGDVRAMLSSYAGTKKWQIQWNLLNNWSSYATSMPWFEGKQVPLPALLGPDQKFRLELVRSAMQTIDPFPERQVVKLYDLEGKMHVRELEYPYLCPVDQMEMIEWQGQSYRISDLKLATPDLLQERMILQCLIQEFTPTPENFREMFRQLQIASGKKGANRYQYQLLRRRLRGRNSAVIQRLRDHPEISNRHTLCDQLVWLGSTFKDSVAVKNLVSLPRMYREYVESLNTSVVVEKMFELVYEPTPEFLQSLEFWGRSYSEMIYTWSNGMFSSLAEAETTHWFEELERGGATCLTFQIQNSNVHSYSELNQSLVNPQIGMLSHYLRAYQEGYTELARVGKLKHQLWIPLYLNQFQWKMTSRLLPMILGLGFGGNPTHCPGRYYQLWMSSLFRYQLPPTFTWDRNMIRCLLAHLRGIAAYSLEKRYDLGARKKIREILKTPFRNHGPPGQILAYLAQAVSTGWNWEKTEFPAICQSLIYQKWISMPKKIKKSIMQCPQASRTQQLSYQLEYPWVTLITILSQFNHYTRSLWKYFGTYQRFLERYEESSGVFQEEEVDTILHLMQEAQALPPPAGLEDGSIINILTMMQDRLF